MTADDTSSLEPRWTPPAVETLAAMLPQYRLEQLIGRSATGAIYGAVQLVLDRPVSIRVLAAHLAADAHFKARFEREARTLATLQHPGIVAIYDFGQTSAGDLYFVTELVDGTELSQIIQGAGLIPSQALDVTVQICEALHHAHSCGVIHRDIKPANILLTRNGRAKLADFGLARPLDADETGSTASAVATGSPAYMAPEQREGHADQRTDIYALGVVLYEMLTGGRPDGLFPRPSTKARMDVRLDQVVIKALQQEPDRRYQQVSEMKTDVDRIRSSHPDRILSSHPQVEVRPTARKQPAPVAVIVCVLTALLVIAGQIFLYTYPHLAPPSVEKPKDRAAAVSPHANRLPDAGLTSATKQHRPGGTEVEAQSGSFADFPLDIDAESTRMEVGVVIAEQNVIIRYRSTAIYCDYAQYDPKTREALLIGHVRIHRDGRLLTAERALYNLETKVSNDFRGETLAFPGVLDRSKIEPSTATAVTQPTSSFPYAKPVAGKPGFVTSPYAPSAGYIDVRGFPKGTQVRDPYSKKAFLVP